MADKSVDDNQELEKIEKDSSNSQLNNIKLHEVDKTDNNSINDVEVTECVDSFEEFQDGEKHQHKGKVKMKDNANEQPYNQDTEERRTTSDDPGSIALILGIIAVVSAVTGYLSLVGLVLGIIALVKGSKIRKVSSSGMAGWVLGIISIVFSGISVFITTVLISHLFFFSPFFM